MDTTTPAASATTTPTLPRARTATEIDPVARLLGETAPVRQRVLRHPVYRELTDLPAIRVFMEHHVFAVWDFMSLLKSLQRALTCVEVPWVPRGDTEIRRMVNEIVLGEESDTTSLGPISHFELYLAAMEAAGADTRPARRFLALIGDGVPVVEATAACGAPTGAAAFVKRTWQVLQDAPLHCIAASFALGREELIPRMFDHLGALDDLHEGRLAIFCEYVARHVEVDGDEHGPMALRLLARLCAATGDPARAWRESAGTVTVALRARADLWDSVSVAIAGARALPEAT
ncbi:DUF3050 domain-containing protein [Streptomyces sp. SID3343]|uniref:DUF3050 domain-containing protein n=1 Tax=Streptomyces sp. SID3343 TaxID=2690260 RepID=UPI00137120AE|nr:DUF3050 domain-containing protein [Streptomyces sp. SID3343]MYW06006.1 DUF3050 domain-containing protein [Streptomyces sp. SID3343]